MDVGGVGGWECTKYSAWSWAGGWGGFEKNEGKVWGVHKIPVGNILNSFEPPPPPLGHKFWPVPKFPFWLNKEISYSKHRIRKSSFQNVVFNPITRLNPIIYNIVEQWCWLKGCWAFKPLFKQGDKGRYEITNDDYVLNTITTDHESRITNDFCLIII